MSYSKRNILRTWILNNIIGFVLSIIFWVFSINISWSLYPNLGFCFYLFYFGASFLSVSIIALAQWVALEGFFTGLRWWILASTGGAIIGLLSIIFLLYISTNGIFIGTFATLSIGCMQCLCIHQSFEQKIRWVLASTIGLSSIFIIGYYNFNIVFIGPIIYVLLTGGCLNGWECRDK
jgi:hypothetical protein